MLTSSKYYKVSTTDGALQNTTFTIKVTDDKPIWLYCPQNNPAPHCAAGMVAVMHSPIVV